MINTEYLHFFSKIQDLIFIVFMIFIRKKTVNKAASINFKLKRETQIDR